jgi:hypothetical protein
MRSNADWTGVIVVTSATAKGETNDERDHLRLDFEGNGYGRGARLET